MIALIAATYREARPLLERLLARKSAETPFHTYHAPAGSGRPACLIVISGMGSERAARAVEFVLLAHRPSAVVNFGLCGALSRDLSRGALLRIGEALDGEAVLAGRPARGQSCSPGFSGGPPRQGNLATVDKPVFDDRRRSTLAEYADVVDMEGYAVAAACRARNVPVHLLKAVSDFADSHGRWDILKHLDTISAVLAETVLRELETLVDSDAAAPSSPVDTPAPAAPAVAPDSSSLPARMARFVKLEHTFFSLPMLFAGAWLGAGGQWPSLGTLALIVVAGTGARTLGMAANRILDRHVDALNPRTARRDLPAGTLSLRAAYAVAAAGLAVYLAACAALGPVCLVLSPIPALAMATYPLLKRFTNLCHLGIGACLALAPLGAYIAAHTVATNALSVSAPAVMLAVFTFAWMSGFDIIYALQDIDSDRLTGVRSLPSALGARGAGALAAALHALAAAAGVGLWLALGETTLSGAALAVMGAGLLLAHWPTLSPSFRFFPIGPIVAAAGALVVLLGDLS
ncbi:MAG: putative 4-hydroxybenzoate polyprenyltransferase [Planctomycetota bacterium]|nr:putative 4-hydroxybenzoate polyprenyltransferase [Planctomycetota bacterium]